jgi:putative transposase
LGLFYRVWSSAEIDPILLRNMRFLGDYIDPKYPDIPEAVRTAIVDVVKKTPGVSAQALVEQGDGFTYEHVFVLIGKGAVYFDLKEAPLTQLDRVRLYPDDRTALARQFAGLSQASATLPTAYAEVPSSTGSAIPPSQSAAQPALSEAAEQALRSARSTDIEVANQRWQIMQSGLDCSRRTLRRWRSLYRQAEQRFGCGYVGLIPRLRDRGNRLPRLPEEVLETADRVIDEHFFSSKGKTKIATYGMLQIECEKLALIVPSYEWFTHRIHHRETTDTAGIRDARFEPQRSEDRLSVNGTEVHGDRPWDAVHIDHTLADLELVDEQTGINLGRPWLTIAFDAYSRRVLAFHLEFERPSYKSCLLAMRECVRRHGRLPECSIVDGGAEFKHFHFETFCARYRILLKTRPGARPYFGSVIERMFGTIGTQFFQNLAGNTHVLRTALKVTASTDPKKQAVWSLEALHDLLSQYFYDIYDQSVHSTLNVSPAQAFKRGTEIGGAREARHVVYDENLIAMTLPSTRSGFAKIQPGMGVKINNRYYWSDEMKNRQFIGQSVGVRYDPWNLALAYAYLESRWVRCISALCEAFNGRSERELMLASAKLLKIGSTAHRRRYEDAKRLAEFFMSVEGDEHLRKQRLKDLAAKRAMESKQPGQEPVFSYVI